MREVDEINKPHVSERVKAAFADLIVMILLASIASQIFSAVETVHDLVRIATMIFIVLLYESITVAAFGSSIGHFMVGITVRNAHNFNEKITIFEALLRTTIKLLLGWLSFLTLSGSENNQAIHDMTVGSVVLYRKKKI